MLGVVIFFSFVFFISQAAVSPPQALSPLSARSSAAHPLALPSSLTLWCSSDSPIKKATFTRSGSTTKIEAKIVGSNASYTFKTPTILDAGDYTCELDTQRGARRETTSVYVRPVVHTDHPEKLDTTKDEFMLEMLPLVVTKGESVDIKCPVKSYPMPNIVWNKDGKPVKLSKRLSSKGQDLRLDEADYEDEGVYTCDAMNEYTVSSKTSRLMLSLSRRLKVKSQYAWVWPLAVIVVILVLLIIIILLCELRKKKQEKQSAYIVED